MVVVDTDILVDAGLGVHEALPSLQQIEQQSLLAISQGDYRFISGLRLLPYP